MSVFAKVEGDSRFLSMVEKDGGWYRVANRIAASAAKVIHHHTELKKTTILETETFVGP